MWLILAFLSLCTLIISLINYSFIVNNSIVILFLSIALVSLFISMVSMKQLIIDFRETKEEIVKKESNIRSFYMYQQLLDPPEMNN